MEQPAGEARRGGISLDALVLILVMGLTIHQDSFREFSFTFTTPTLNAIVVGLLGLYLLIDVLGAPLLSRLSWPRRLFYGSKSAVLAAIVVLVVILPTFNAIGLRHASQPWRYVHDTSINVEAATTFLLAGKDPYAQTYFHTPLAKFGWHSEPKYHYGPNPALWWTDTFPGQELITVPFMAGFRAALGWFDERFIYLLAFALTVLLLIRLAPTATTRLALVAAVSLNPLWISEFIYGQNDILVLAEILVVLLFSMQGRWRLALIALAIGGATKQTTLLLIPFYLWWLAPRLGPSWRVRLERLALLSPWLLVPLILMVGPFAFWDWTAFYNGNFAYVAGTIPHSYPIQGYDGWGMASFVLWSGLVPNPNAYFPFSAFEVAVAVPLGVLLLRRFRATTPVTVMLGAYATVLFPIFYFSRFFHASYVAFTIDLFLVAYFAHHPAHRRSDDGHISFDVLLPLLLIPQLIKPPNNRVDGITASLALGLLLAYVVVAAIAPWNRLGSAPARRIAAVARAVVLAGLAEVAVFWRSLDGITDRLRWNAPYAFVHDTALQVQISAGALLKGQNPYTMSVWDTPLPHLYMAPGDTYKSLAHNLPLTHNPHLPLGFLLGAPFQALFNRLHLLFDEVYLYLLALILVAIVASLLVRPSARQLALLGAVVFSPLFAAAVILGQDDVLVVLALGGTLLLLERRHPVVASLAVGVALATKLTAWPLAPLFLVYIAAVDREAARDVRRRMIRLALCLAGMIVPLLAVTVPFLRWDAHAFIADAFLYPLGLMRDGIPLDLQWGTGFSTIGFGRLALGLGWAHLNGYGFMGLKIAVAAGAVVLAAMVVRLWRAPSLPLLMAGYLVLLFTLEYFGRFMIDTTLGYLAVLAPLSFFLPAARSQPQALPLPLPVASDETAVAV